MMKAGKRAILMLLCTVVIFCHTGCAKNKEAAKIESSIVAVASNTPDVSASPSLSPEPMKIDRNEDFILGVDISDIKSEYSSGARYFDFDGNKLFYAPETERQKGFCTFLNECGFNWVHIRTEYGTNDLEDVKEAGKLASDAGLKVLIEFSYPEFSSDMDIDIEEKTEALKEYMVESLIEIIDYGVDVCMVQISNKCAGEIDWTNICLLINSGCNAIRYVADTMEKEILVTLHFTDIVKSQYETTMAVLENNQIDYDIFATSYHMHTDAIKVIAEEYDKEVIVIANKVKGKKADKIVTDMTQSAVNIGEVEIGVFFETELFGSKGHPLKSSNMFKYIAN